MAPFITHRTVPLTRWTLYMALRPVISLSRQNGLHPGHRRIQRTFGELPITIRPSYGSSTTTAAQVAAYLYPAYHVERTNHQNRVSGKGKR